MASLLAAAEAVPDRVSVMHSKKRRKQAERLMEQPLQHASWVAEEQGQHERFDTLTVDWRHYLQCRLWIDDDACDPSNSYVMVV